MKIVKATREKYNLLKRNDLGHIDTCAVAMLENTIMIFYATRENLGKSNFMLWTEESMILDIVK
jgi:hypothetical protein